MKAYVAPQISMETVLPDTMISSNYSSCYICEDLENKTQIDNQPAANYGATPGQTVISGNNFFLCTYN